MELLRSTVNTFKTGVVFAEHITSHLAPHLGQDFVFAGGFVRDGIINDDKWSDVDIWTTKQWDGAPPTWFPTCYSTATVLGYSRSVTLNPSSPEAVTMRCRFPDRSIKVDVFYTPYKTLEELVDSFDFTVCQFAYRPSTMEKNGGLYYTRQAIRDLNSMTLRPHKITNLSRSIERANRYGRKGFILDHYSAERMLRLEEGVEELGIRRSIN